MSAVNPIEYMLQDRACLLADGATGTNLFDMGLQSGDAPEMWNFEHQDRIARLHLEFVNAGCDLILTNTFGGNRHRLKLHDAQDQAYELNRQAALIARGVVDAQDRPVIVGGSVGPTGELFVPLGEMTPDEAVDAFLEQINGLKDGGADVIWIETMSAAEEIEAAAEAARRADMPYCFTASFDTAGRTMMGIPPKDLGALATGMETPPTAFGANCGVGASDLLVSISEMTAAYPDAIVVAKANCGIPQYKDGKFEFTGTPELMAKYARMARDCGARIIGGCCGSDGVVVKAIADALKDYEPGAVPSQEQVIEALGPLSNGPSPHSHGAEEDKGERRRRRRRGGVRRRSGPGRPCGHRRLPAGPGVLPRPARQSRRGPRHRAAAAVPGAGRNCAGTLRRSARGRRLNAVAACTGVLPLQGSPTLRDDLLP